MTEIQKRALAARATTLAEWGVPVTPAIFEQLAAGVGNLQPSDSEATA